MYNRLKALYDAEKITSAHLSIAVGKGWITQEDVDKILAGLPPA